MGNTVRIYCVLISPPLQPQSTSRNMSHCSSWPSSGDSRECAMKWFLLPPAVFWGSGAAGPVCSCERKARWRCLHWEGRKSCPWCLCIPRGVCLSGWHCEHPALQRESQEDAWEGIPAWWRHGVGRQCLCPQPCVHPGLTLSLRPVQEHQRVWKTLCGPTQ